jgi:hypothetical protein
MGAVTEPLSLGVDVECWASVVIEAFLAGFPTLLGLAADVTAEEGAPALLILEACV